jgi:hypothetical protein
MAAYLHLDMRPTLHQFMTGKQGMVTGSAKNTDLPRHIAPVPQRREHLDFPRIPRPRARLENPLDPLGTPEQIFCSRGHLRSRLPVARPCPCPRGKPRLLVHVERDVNVIPVRERRHRAVESDVCPTRVEEVERMDLPRHPVRPLEYRAKRFPMWREEVLRLGLEE